MHLNNHNKGILLAATGVLVLSPDSLLVRLIDVDLWTLTFLRGSFMALSLFIIHLLICKGRPLQQFLHLDKYAWWIVGLIVINTYFFVASIQTTSVAHTLIIVGAVPVAAAILGLIFLKQKVPKHTLWTIGIVLISLVLVLYDDASSSFLGDFYALVTCLLLACVFIVANKTTVQNMLAPMCLSGLLMALISLPQAELQALTIEQLLLSMLLGLLVGLAFCMINMAPRYIPSAQVAIFMPLETVFGTLLAWWFIGEYPGLISIVAGLVIVAALILNARMTLTDKTCQTSHSE